MTVSKVIDTKYYIRIYGLLICTLISENQGVEKSRFVSNPRKISGSSSFDLLSGLAPGFFRVNSINSAFLQGGDLKKDQGLPNLKFF